MAGAAGRRRARRAQPHARRSRRRSSGRDEELRLLKDLFHATARERRARLVSVIGQAGIGKSRLAWEFLKYIDGLVETVWWHDGRSPAYGEGVTFWALGEMVRGRAGLAGDRRRSDDPRQGRRHGRRRTCPTTDERRWIEPRCSPARGRARRDRRREELFAAWRTFFERLAATAPIVLVFEDLHWADAGPLDFIDHLLEWSPRASRSSSHARAARSCSSGGPTGAPASATSWP